MKENVSDFVKIGASLGGILLVIIVLFLIFARDNSDALISITWAFVVFGAFLAFFQHLSKGKK